MYSNIEFWFQMAFAQGRNIQELILNKDKIDINAVMYGLEVQVSSVNLKDIKYKDVTFADTGDNRINELLNEIKNIIKNPVKMSELLKIAFTSGRINVLADKNGENNKFLNLNTLNSYISKSDQENINTNYLDDKAGLDLVKQNIHNLVGGQNMYYHKYLKYKSKYLKKLN